MPLQQWKRSGNSPLNLLYKYIYTFCQINTCISFKISWSTEKSLNIYNAFSMGFKLKFDFVCIFMSGLKHPFLFLDLRLDGNAKQVDFLMRNAIFVKYEIHEQCVFFHF